MIRRKTYMQASKVDLAGPVSATASSSAGDTDIRLRTGSAPITNWVWAQRSQKTVGYGSHGVPGRRLQRRHALAAAAGCGLVSASIA